MSAYLAELLATLYDIDITECNGVFQDRIAQRLEAHGVPIADYTLGDLRALIVKENEAFNAEHRASVVPA